MMGVGGIAVSEYVGEHAPPMREVKADVEAALIELVTSSVGS